MYKKFVARIIRSNDKISNKEDKQVQTVEEHLRNVADISEKNLKNVGLGSLSKLIGLYHDAGKYTDKFQEYIENATSLDKNKKDKAIRGSVNHTFAGVQLIFENHYYNNHKDKRLKNLECLTTEIMAFVSGSHHGSFDILDIEGSNGFEHRLNTNVEIGEVKKNFYKEINEEELMRLFEESLKEMQLVIGNISKIRGKIINKEKGEEVEKKVNKEFEEDSFYYYYLISRLLLSSLIDADRSDAASFTIENQKKIIQLDDLEKMWHEKLETVKNKINELNVKSLNKIKENDSTDEKNNENKQEIEITELRNIISMQAENLRNKDTGIYKLTVPTGGGKTLSSLRAALAHAKEKKKQKIFFVIPLLSILEQNAKEIRKFIDDDGIILEHHSNIIRTKEDLKNKEELDNNELLCENWNSPIVITTLFQLLLALFDGSNSSIRRMHALCNSIIVIDEPQQIPRKMLAIFNLAINFLTYICNATVLFTSATQPGLEVAKRAILFGTKEEGTKEEIANASEELVTLDEEKKKSFERTTIEIVKKESDSKKIKEFDIDEIVEFIIEKEVKSNLIICNKKETAKKLFMELTNKKNEGKLKCEKLFHLSTSMCMQHRKDTLEEVNSCLEQGDTIICVSTQLVEAGVDFSFECVIRSMAGVDNILQAAGRCNRNGEFSKLCTVYVVKIKEELKNLPEIAESRNATMEVLGLDESVDLHLESSIKQFYNFLYKDMKENYQFFPITEDQTSYYNLMGSNKENPASKKKNKFLNQSAKRAGKAFKVFEENTVDIIVPYSDSGKSLIAELMSDKAKYDLNYKKELLKKLKLFSISLYKNKLNSIRDGGTRIVENENSEIIILKEHLYDNELGFCEETTLDFVSV